MLSAENSQISWLLRQNRIRNIASAKVMFMQATPCRAAIEIEIVFLLFLAA